MIVVQCIRIGYHHNSSIGDAVRRMETTYNMLDRPLSFTLRRHAAPQRKYNKRDLFNGIQFVLKTGYQWRALPNDFPRGVLSDANSDGLLDTVASPSRTKNS